MAGAGVPANSKLGRRDVGGAGSWIQHMRLSYKGWVTKRLIIEKIIFSQGMRIIGLFFLIMLEAKIVKLGVLDS